LFSWKPTIVTTEEGLKSVIDISRQSSGLILRPLHYMPYRLTQRRVTQETSDAPLRKPENSQQGTEEVI
jgi:hypothetical protein